MIFAVKNENANVVKLKIYLAFIGQMPWKRFCHNFSMETDGGCFRLIPMLTNIQANQR